MVAGQSSFKNYLLFHFPFSKDQQRRFSKRDHIISRAIAINYYKSKLKQLLSVPTERLLLHCQEKTFLIRDIQFDILLPGAMRKNFFRIEKILKPGLQRGVIAIDGKEDIHVHFRFLDKQKGKIQIVDAPFLLQSCLELHQTEVKEICQLKNEEIALQHLRYDYPREAHSFMQTLFYLMNTDQLPTENIHFRRF